jgi:hypothetical protein
MSKDYNQTKQFGGSHAPHRSSKKCKRKRALQKAITTNAHKTHQSSEFTLHAICTTAENVTTQRRCLLVIFSNCAFCGRCGALLYELSLAISSVMGSAVIWCCAGRAKRKHIQNKCSTVCFPSRRRLILLASLSPARFQLKNKTLLFSSTAKQENWHQSPREHLAHLT